MTTTETALAAPSEADQERSELAEIFDHELAVATKGEGWDLPTFFLAKEAELDALEEAIKTQARALLAHVGARRRALHWRYGAKLKLAVDADLKKQAAARLGKPKKSIDYATGKAGYRTCPASLKIIDEPSLKEWCLKNCEAALEIKIARTTPIKEHAKATGEVAPGAVFIDAHEKFFPSIEEPALPGEGIIGRIGGAE